MRITPIIAAILRERAAHHDLRSCVVRVVALFEADVLLGLRPCEWAGARWVDASHTNLIVRNAKVASTVVMT